MNKEKFPKVFLSYSWTSPEHEEFVIDLAEKLMTDGILVVLDKWDLKEGQEKYKFMESMVTDKSVNKVLVIIDNEYAVKADKRVGGVGTESQIISNEVYEKVDQEKFIPIVTEYDKKRKPILPIYFKNRIYIDFSTPEKFYPEYEKLIRNIYNKPLVKKPNIGVAPAFITEDEPMSNITIHKFSTFKDAFLNNKNSAKLLSKDFLDSIIGILEDLRVTDSSTNFDDKIVETINKFKPYRDQLIEYFDLVSINTVDNDYFDQIFSFLETFLNYYYPPESAKSHFEESFDNYKFILREIFLYLNAILLKNKKTETIKLLTTEKYFVENREEYGNWDFPIIDNYLRSLDKIRNARLKLNRLSVTADMIRERSDNPIINHDKVMEIDFILTLSALFSGTRLLWFPRSILYRLGWRSKPFELFQRAETQRHFLVIGNIFDVKNRDELQKKFEEVSKKNDLSRWRFEHESINFIQLMNLEKLYNG